MYRAHDFLDYYSIAIDADYLIEELTYLPTVDQNKLEVIKQELEGKFGISREIKRKSRTK